MVNDENEIDKKWVNFMAFNYNKNKNEDSGSFWTSYSDLFLGMSVIFLLLYVTASLRQGTSGIQQQIQNQKLTMQVEDLKNQLKMYDSVKKDYLNNEAKPEEEKQYKELMDKLTLLREEATDEKNRLHQSALENEKKEKALNQYQQMVRNIMNANLMAKAKIKTREDLINEQDEEIDTQDSQISKLEKDISQKKKQIADNQNKIADANEQLEKRLEDLKAVYKQKKMSEAAYAKKVEALKQENETKLEQLEANSMAVEKQLANVQNQLGSVTGKLAGVTEDLTKTKSVLAKTEVDKQKLAGQLSMAEQEHNKQVAKLQNEFSDQAARDRAKFQQELAKERVTGAEKAKREAAFRAQAAQKEKDLGQKLATLSKDLAEKEGALGKNQEKLARAGQEIKGQAARIKEGEALLAKARAEADARKQISKDIKEGFKKAGVEADVNENTGEVVINFGDVYFDNDSAKLKDKMKETLKKAMPVYSKSLLGNQKISQKISAIEIIGFASPTYKGKYVDPQNLDAQTGHTAMEHNLDLSFRRAKEIFNFVTDHKKLEFEHQKSMLPLMKVTGKSFLAEKLPEARSLATGEAKSKDFCSIHDCRKAQRVIIKFSFEDKK